MLTIGRIKTKSIGLILRKSRLVKHITEGIIAMKGRRCKRRKYLLIELQQFI